MHWKTKARIQHFISLLPSSISYATYYWIQRRFGGLKTINPVKKLKYGIATWTRIKEFGYDPSGRTFLEVGTGWVPIVPLAYWLMGAKETITIDLNPYLKSELVLETLRYISNHTEQIRKLFGPLLYKDRMADLIRFTRSQSFSTNAFLDLSRITYVAPCDAANTKLPSRCINFHTSCRVFEHIPLESLENIINEGNRIISDNGLFIHRIDYSDHFAHSDKVISKINFLQFSDEEWNKYSGNRYMYMNRLRHDDYIHLFQSAGHRIIADDPSINQQVRELLRHNGLRLNEQFISKSEEVLSITGAWIVSKKKNG